MGACCSKPKPTRVGDPEEERNTFTMSKQSAKSSSAKNATPQQTATTNILHNQMGDSLPLIVCNHPSQEECRKSLVSAPPAEDLLVRFWINKRGHLVRSWKKRYCVLEKNEIKYYAKPFHEPPYGKNLKGHVALFGSVCIASESEDFKEINVEIFGSLGQKDLFFMVENTEEGKEFVNALQWAIRRATLAVLVRNAKTTASWKQSKGDHNVAGSDWTKHHQILYEESIKGLKFPQIYEFVVSNPDGSIVIRPGVMKLWTAYGNDFTPSQTTEADLMGLAIHLWQPNEPSLDQQQEHDQYTIITFEDIADVSYQYIDVSTTALLKPNVQKFLHKQCSAGRYLVFSIRSEFGMTFHVLSCCLHGYDDAFVYMQNVLLFLQARKKLLEASTANDKETSVKGANRLAVIQAVKLLNE